MPHRHRGISRSLPSVVTGIGYSSRLVTLGLEVPGFFPVKIFNGEGKLKKTITKNKLSKIHWRKFDIQSQELGGFMSRKKGGAYK